MIVQKIPIDSIVVKDRIRRQVNVDDLVASIKELGLLSPIIINSENILLAGGRRLAACKTLGWQHIDAVIKTTSTAEENLLIEISENQRRSEFTREEVVNAGIKLERIERVLAEERCGFRSDLVKNLPPGWNPGKTREIVAAKLGISGTQYEREKFIVENHEWLSDGQYLDWNIRKISTNKAYNIIKAQLRADEQTSVAKGEKVPETSPLVAEEIPPTIAALEDRVKELTIKCREHEETIRRLQQVNNPASTPIKDADTAFDFYTKTNDFVATILAPFSYNDVINRYPSCENYIITGCNNLIDAATTIIRRFKNETIIDA